MSYDVVWREDMRVSDYSTGTQQGGTLGPYVGRSILNTKINLLLYRTICLSQGFQCIFYIFDVMPVRCARVL